MSYLYDHRDQLDGLRFLAEIAYRFTYGIPPSDRDDVEQDIVIAMMRVIARRGYPQTSWEERYLRGVARMQIKKYWCKKCYQAKVFSPLPDDKEIAAKEAIDIDSQLDAAAVLATLPTRLLKIGRLIQEGEKLSAADQGYWQRHKKKLIPGRTFNLSDEEKRRIVRLHTNGVSVDKIGRTIGRSTTTVRMYLYHAGLRGIGEVPLRLRKNKPAAIEGERVAVQA